MMDKNKLDSTSLVVLGKKDIDPIFEEQWKNLFELTFKQTRARADLVWTKYNLNNCMFCCVSIESKLAACYGGLLLDLNDKLIFLSTDTMSDGRFPNATVKLGKILYETLQDYGVIAVCGYPNKNIVKIRSRFLGWKYSTQLNLFLGFPYLSKVENNTPVNPTWSVSRPIHGFFYGKKFGVKLLGEKTDLTRRGFSSHFLLALSNGSPGRGFLKVPEWIVGSKVFGYKFLSDDLEDQNLFLNSIKKLSADNIDVP